MTEFIQSLASVNPVWMYAAIFLFAFLENIFPPLPSDVIVVFGGAMTAMERGNFLAALTSASVGSTGGFIAMYLIGKWFGARVIETRRLGFINVDTVHRFEHWFSRYGYWLIVANRFLSGTRAVISFVAGMSQLRFTTTLILSFISSVVWYGLLVYAGYALGEHWTSLQSYLVTYSRIVTGILLFVAVVWFIWYRIRRSRGRAPHD